jgi:hypothetical protein
MNNSTNQMSHTHTSIPFVNNVFTFSSALHYVPLLVHGTSYPRQVLPHSFFISSLSVIPDGKTSLHTVTILLFFGFIWIRAIQLLLLVALPIPSVY